MSTNEGNMKTLQLKMVLLGEQGTGKSCLVARFIKGHFLANSESTIGAAFFTQRIFMDDTSVKFEIWDTAGQERFRTLAPMYYRGAQAALVLYDITNRNSFEQADVWLAELRRHGPPNICIALAGNKIDIESERVVSFEDGQNLAKQNGLTFFETSAKTSSNINTLFVSIARSVLMSTNDSEFNPPDFSVLNNSDSKKKCC